MIMENIYEAMQAAGGPSAGTEAQLSAYPELFWKALGDVLPDLGTGQGPVGPAGADGADGADGAPGPQGPAGADGATGPGYVGVVYDEGLDKLTFDGVNTEDVDIFGIKGPKGDDGPIGPSGGLQGPPGADGADGADGVDGSPGPGYSDAVYTAATDTLEFVGFGQASAFITGIQGPAGADGEGSGTGLQINVRKNPATVPGDGVNDDAPGIRTHIQDLLNRSGGVGGELVFPIPPVRYRFDTPVIFPASISIVGEINPGELTADEDGTDAAMPEISWGGADWGTLEDPNAMETHTICIWKSETPGEVIFGGGARNINFTATAGAAARACAASSMQNGRFLNIRAREIGHSAVSIDSGNGAPSQGNVIDVHYDWGADSAEPNGTSNGVYLGGGDLAATVPTYDQDVIGNTVRARGEVHDGALVYLAGAEENRIEVCDGELTITGTGEAIRFGDSGTEGAKNNVVGYLRGPVLVEANTYGNRALHWNSKGGELKKVGAGQFHFSALDFNDARLYETHRYAMTDKLPVTTGMFAPNTGTPAAQGIWNSISSSWIFPQSVDRGVGVYLPSPYRWAVGNILIVRVAYGVSPGATGDVRMRARIGAVPKDSTMLPEEDVEQTVTIPGTPDTRIITTDFSLDLDVGVNDGLVLSVSREGTDAADTSTADVHFLGAELIYFGLGPVSIGSNGPFMPTLPYVNP